jgi:hypothetical protein
LADNNGDGDVDMDVAVVRGVSPGAAGFGFLDAESSLALSFFLLSFAMTPTGAMLAALATVERLTAALPLEMVPSSLYMATITRAILRFSSFVLGLEGRGALFEDIDSEVEDVEGGRGWAVGGVAIELLDRVDPGVAGLPAAAAPVALEAGVSSGRLAAFHTWTCSRLDPGLVAGGLVMIDPSAGLFLSFEVPVLGVVFLSFLVLTMMTAKRGKAGWVVFYSYILQGFLDSFCFRAR